MLGNLLEAAVEIATIVAEAAYKIAAVIVKLFN
mgnify:CR=1 FL=1